MTEPAQPKPPAAWLDQLHEAGQWERLEKVARESLAADPHDAAAHRHCAWALVKLERAKEIEPHVSFLLAEDAEDIQHLQLAVLWHLNAKRWKQARSHLDSALALAPEDAALWFLGGVLESARGRLDEASRCASRARQLDPDNADYAHVSIMLDSAQRTSTADAWKTVREYEQALGLDPENDALMASMGDVFLNELEMPARAEELYRQALAIDPTDRSHQKRLWQAIQSRNLLFRTLRLPISGMNFVGNVLRGLRVKPWLILFLLLGFKLVAAYLAWLLLAVIVFAPPAWFFEWLVMADIQRVSRAADRLGPWWLAFHRRPFLLRLACCLTLVLAFWWGLFAWTGIPPTVGFILIGLFFGCNLLILAVRIAMRHHAARRGAHSTAPPPLPRRPGQPPPLPGAH